VQKSGAAPTVVLAAPEANHSLDLTATVKIRGDRRTQLRHPIPKICCQRGITGDDRGTNGD
jgi:hypothetical protein